MTFSTSGGGPDHHKACVRLMFIALWWVRACTLMPLAVAQGLFMRGAGCGDLSPGAVSTTSNPSLLSACRLPTAPQGGRAA